MLLFFQRTDLPFQVVHVIFDPQLESVGSDPKEDQEQDRQNCKGGYYFGFEDSAARRSIFKQSPIKFRSFFPVTHIIPFNIHQSQDFPKDDQGYRQSRQRFHLFVKLYGTVVFRATTHSLVDSALFTSVHSIIVETSIDVVEVVETIDLVHPAARQLHQGEVHHHIVGTRPKLAVLVLEVFLLNLEEEFCSIGPQMGESLRGLPVSFVFLVSFGVFGGETQHYIASLIVPEEVGVDYSSFIFLVASVESFQHIFPNEFVVGVKVQHNGIGTAVVMGSDVYIFEGGFPLFVFDVGVAVFADLVEVEVFAVEFVGVVGGGVVDDHHEVVGVVLLEDGVQVVLDPELGVVVVPRHHHAHRQLLFELLEVPNPIEARELLGLHPTLLLVPTGVYSVVKGGQIQTREVLFVSSEGNALFVEFSAGLALVGVVENLFNSK